MGTGGNPRWGGVSGRAQLLGTCRAPGVFLELQMPPREDDGRGSEGGASASAGCVCRRVPPAQLRLSPGPPLPLPRLAATGGTESRPGCGVGRRGRRFTHLSFAPAAASCVSPGRRPGRGAEFASWGPGAVRERLGAPGCVDIGALSPPGGCSLVWDGPWPGQGQGGGGAAHQAPNATRRPRALRTCGWWPQDAEVAWGRVRVRGCGSRTAGAARASPEDSGGGGAGRGREPCPPLS